MKKVNALIPRYVNLIRRTKNQILIHPDPLDLIECRDMHHCIFIHLSRKISFRREAGIIKYIKPTGVKKLQRGMYPQLQLVKFNISEFFPI